MLFLPRCLPTSLHATLVIKKTFKIQLTGCPGGVIIWFHAYISYTGADPTNGRQSKGVRKRILLLANKCFHRMAHGVNSSVCTQSPRHAQCHFVIAIQIQTLTISNCPTTYTIAAIGRYDRPIHSIFSPVIESVIIVNLVTSDPVPAVVGI